MEGKIALLETERKQDHMESNEKLNEVLSLLKGTTTNGPSIVQRQVIEIVPDWEKTMKPKLDTRDLPKAIFEYVDNPTQQSYNNLPTKSKEKHILSRQSEKYFLSDIKIATNVVEAFIPLGYPTYSDNMDRVQWKLDMNESISIGFKNVFEFIEEKGMKKPSKDTLSKSYLKTTVFKAEVARRKQENEVVEEVHVAEEEITNENDITNEREVDEVHIDEEDIVDI